MKKFGKVILSVVLIGAIGFAGFMLGSNVDLGQGGTTRDKELISEMDSLKGLLDKNFLFDYKDEDLYNGALKGMFANLGDPYTSYYPKEEFSKLMENLDGRYKGIGVTVSPSKEGLIKVVQVFENSPAKEAGMKAGDFIKSVEGNVFDATQLDKAVALIRGEPGTKVKIEVLRVSEDKPEGELIPMLVERRDVTVDTVYTKTLNISGKKIGYLRLSAFDDITWDDFKEKYSKLKNSDIEGMVLDLRNNPGGALDVCLDIADTFLDEGVIVTTEDKNGNVITEKSDSNKDDIPMTVLINENSASASEILAGAFKDRGRAKIVGTKSFGKGIVQKLFPLENGAGAKITISEYKTPNGNKINKIGVKPDIEVENKNQELDLNNNNFKKDQQFLKALAELLKEIK
ncbi:peptidase, S41 family [Anaerococcus lactolyticus ATCC 51172]|uniref:Peptidase, S41 family n=1 Tax=Anaerococcus lactolyticus ATCC 51172 TaxID=525254 RepID=C2BEL0_9FIRM|nr:S41 family peptidase [Anaerococcus lactolyticus]EEI86683.1 peptidase, S41 family [Anaerococcus lactolyticus ATCC 51172]